MIGFGVEPVPVRDKKVVKGDRGAGCLTLFGSVFLFAGLAAMYSGRNESGGQFWAAVGMGGLFAAVGGGIILFSRWAAAKVREQSELESRYPDQPWMWRADWAQGRVRGGSKTEMIFAWCFALLWNAISSPALIFGWEEISRKEDLWVLGLVLLFPLVGLGLLWWAIRAALRYRKFGVSEMQLDTLPGVVGGKLKGRISTNLKAPPRGGLSLSLRQIRKVESGDSTTEKLVWEHEKSLSAGELSRDYRGVSVPVDFTIPSKCEPTDPGFPQEGVVWKLSAAADVEGVDFASVFEIPVFRTADSRDDVEEELEEAEPDWNPRTGEHAKPSYVERASAGGGVEYLFPAGRNRGTAFGTAVFCLIWVGAGAAMHHFGIPWFFLAVWGLFAVLICWAALDLWFGKWRVVVEQDELRSMYSWPFGRRTYAFRFDEIKSIDAVTGMTQNETMTQAAKAWYDVEVRPRTGKARAIVKSIRSKSEAHRFVQDLERRIRAGRL